MWNWYYKLLARRPHLVLISISVLSIACIVVSLTFKKLPEFSEPSLVSAIPRLAPSRPLTLNWLVLFPGIRNQRHIHFKQNHSMEKPHRGDENAWVANRKSNG